MPKNLYPRLTHQIITRRVSDIINQVGLNQAVLGNYPNQLSGGQCQRVGIARALISKPKLLICDEIVSALDVSLRAQILNLLKNLQKQLQLTIVFISHDLNVVKYLCDRVVVMHDGKLIETGSTEQIFTNPQHSYTKKLLSAVPV